MSQPERSRPKPLGAAGSINTAVDPAVLSAFKKKTGNSYNPAGLPYLEQWDMRQPFWNAADPARIYAILHFLAAAGVDRLSATIAVALCAVETGGLWLGVSDGLTPWSGGLTAPWALTQLTGSGPGYMNDGVIPQFDRLLPVEAWPQGYYNSDPTTRPGLWGQRMPNLNLAGGSGDGFYPTIQFQTVGLATPTNGPLSIMLDSEVVAYMHYLDIRTMTDLLDVANGGTNIRRVFEYVLIRAKAHCLDSFSVGPFRHWMGLSGEYQRAAALGVSGTPDTWDDIVDMYAPDDVPGVFKYAAAYSREALSAANAIPPSLQQGISSLAMWTAADDQAVSNLIAYHSALQHRNLPQLERIIRAIGPDEHGTFGSYLRSWLQAIPFWWPDKGNMPQWSSWPAPTVTTDKTFGISADDWNRIGRLGGMVAGMFAGAAMPLLTQVVNIDIVTAVRSAMQTGIGLVQHESWSSITAMGLASVSQLNIPHLYEINQLRALAASGTQITQAQLALMK